MSIRNKILASLVTLALCSITALAQEKALSAVQQNEIKAISTENYETFKSDIQPLIKQMGVKKIVGLGEGTHGTAEFYKVRYYITQILIEDYGFNHVAFENDVTEVWQFNKQLATTQDLNGLMKKYFLTLWQNEETKELMQWVKDYNSTHDKRVSIDGIDYPIQLPDIAMIKTLLALAKNSSFEAELELLTKFAALQDKSWHGMNKKGYKIDRNVLRPAGKNGYKLSDSLENIFKNLAVESIIKSDLLLAIGNLKQGFEAFVKKNNRDSLMAYNTSQLIKNSSDKVVVWAHNAHLAKQGIYNNAVGGTGGFILKYFPNNYFALGTSTATGTFGGTTDARAVNNSLIAPYVLKKPIKGSWEELLSTADSPDFYFNTATFSTDKDVRPLRFVGYGIKSDDSTYDKTNLTDLFDAVIFLKHTNAPTPLK